MSSRSGSACLASLPQHHSRTATSGTAASMPTAAAVAVSAVGERPPAGTMHVITMCACIVHHAP
eukprot:352550-Chlamydomonas_euryale.AAC.8